MSQWWSLRRKRKGIVTPPQSAKPRYTSTAGSIDRMSATASRPFTAPIRPTDTLALRSTIVCDATRRPFPAFGATSTRKIRSSRSSVVSGSNVNRLCSAKRSLRSTIHGRGLPASPASAATATSPRFTQVWSGQGLSTGGRSSADARSHASHSARSSGDMASSSAFAEAIARATSAPNSGVLVSGSQNWSRAQSLGPLPGTVLLDELGAVQCHALHVSRVAQKATTPPAPPP